MLKESKDCPMELPAMKNTDLPFMKPSDKRARKDYALMAALWLLTASHRLCQTRKRHIENTVIDFDNLHLKGSTPPNTCCTAALKTFTAVKTPFLLY